MREAGYDVNFREFEGGHTVPPPISDAAVRWWLDGAPSPPGA
jgi:predicted esterase